MFAQDGPQLFVQQAVGGIGLGLQAVVQQVAAEIGGHEDDGVAKVDLAPFTVSHESTIKHLVKQIEHVAVRLFDLVQQHNTVGPLPLGFGQHTALAIADVTGRRAFELADGVGFLVLGKVQGDQ